MASNRKFIKTKEFGNNKIYSLNPVLMKTNLIKISSNQDGNVLVIILNMMNSQTVVKYFTNEIDANQFIISVVD